MFSVANCAYLGFQRIPSNLARSNIVPKRKHDSRASTVVGSTSLTKDHIFFEARALSSLESRDALSSSSYYYYNYSSMESIEKLQKSRSSAVKSFF